MVAGPMRLAKFLPTSGVASRRAPSRSCARAGAIGGEMVTDPARDVERRHDSSRSTERRSAGQRAGWCTRSTSRPGVVSTASDTARRRTVVSLVPSAAAALPGRAARHRHHRPDPAHQRRRARLPADASELRGDADLPGAARHAPVREAALRALRAGVELDDGLTAPARVTRVAPDTIELTIHEGRKRQVKRMCEHVGHPVRRASQRVRFGPVRARRSRAGRAPAAQRAGGQPAQERWIRSSSFLSVVVAQRRSRPSGG